MRRHRQTPPRCFATRSPHNRYEILQKINFVIFLPRKTQELITLASHVAINCSPIFVPSSHFRFVYVNKSTFRLSLKYITSIAYQELQLKSGNVIQLGIQQCYLPIYFNLDKINNQYLYLYTIRRQYTKVHYCGPQVMFPCNFIFFQGKCLLFQIF